MSATNVYVWPPVKITRKRDTPNSAYNSVRLHRVCSGLVSYPRFVLFFRRVRDRREVTISFIMSVRPYICPHWTTCLPPEGFFMKINRHRLPPWIRSLELFCHRRVAIVSWGVHDFFFLWVCIWGRVSEVWCCPFLRDGWSRFVCIWISRLVFPRPLVLFLWLVWSCISFDTS